MGEYLISTILANNTKKSWTTKIRKHIPCGHLMVTIWTFDNVENLHSLYCGKDFMKTFGKYLKEHSENIIE